MIRVGEKFREERLRKGLTIEEIAKTTKIRAPFLVAIEKGEYGKLPSSTYVSGFVKNYAEFLEMPVSETLALFRREFNEKAAFKILPEGLSHKEEFSVKRIKLADTIKIVIIVFLILSTYIGFQYRYAFINPPLEVFAPREGSLSLSQNIAVSGKTDTNVSVFVNNDPAALDSDGNFSKTISLFTGKTTITIKAINNFGRQTILQRHVEVK